MNRGTHEITAPINRDELLRLLNTMTPAQQQAITTRACISEIEAELARIGMTTGPTTKADPDAPRLFGDVDLDGLLAANVSNMVAPRTPKPVPPPVPRARTDSSRPKRKSVQPFSQVAALLPPCQPIRAPRPTRSPPMKRATTQNRSLAVADKKAPRTVAELRARLDSGETPAQWAEACDLSPQVLAELTAEEIAMLPAGFREALPEAPAEDPSPRIETASEPGGEVAEIYSPPLTQRLRAAAPQRFTTIVASLAVLFLVVLCAAHFLG